jgi:hypothetical protein
MIPDAVKKAVLDAIPWGKANAVISDRINERAKISDPDYRTNSKTRDVIRELLINDHEPIVSDPSCGYWRTRDPKDLWKYAADLKGRADGNMIRREAVLEILQANMRQQDLF